MCAKVHARVLEINNVVVLVAQTCNAVKIAPLPTNVPTKWRFAPPRLTCTERLKAASAIVFVR